MLNRGKCTVREEAVERSEDLDIGVQVNSALKRDGLKTNVVSGECPGSNRDSLAQKTGIESGRAFHIPAHNFVIWHKPMPTIHATLMEFWERIVTQPAIVYSSGNAFGRCWQSTDLRRTISGLTGCRTVFHFHSNSNIFQGYK